MTSRLESLAKRVLDSFAALRVIEVLGHRSENRMTEFGMLAQAFQFAQINEVDGDYFEFGLWRGHTFCHAHKMKRRYGLQNLFLRGFDSFLGLPEHEPSPDNIWYPGQFDCSEAELRKILRRCGLREHEYDLVAGWYNESLNEDLDRRLDGVKAAIVYVDCDLYESTIDVLRFIDKYLVNGSIVCFDDFYNNRGAPDQGEQRALAEFIETKDSATVFIPYFDYSPLGKSFIVRRC